VNTPVPPHYTAFRLLLVLVLVTAVAALVWWLADPLVLAEVLDFLGVGQR
jgi:hypothetical protein